jgi:hypothetical protein
MNDDARNCSSVYLTFTFSVHFPMVFVSAQQTENGYEIVARIVGDIGDN